MKLRAVCSFLVTILTLLLPISATAQPSTLTYEVQGRLVPVGGADPLGLAGAGFRFMFTVDATAAPTRVKQDPHRSSALYAGGVSSLEIIGAANAAVNGVHRSSSGAIDLVDTYSGDYCLHFGARFETPAGNVSAPAVCFAPGALRGTELQSISIEAAETAAFPPLSVRGGLYAIAGGSIRGEGGAQ